MLGDHDPAVFPLQPVYDLRQAVLYVCEGHLLAADIAISIATFSRGSYAVHPVMPAGSRGRSAPALAPDLLPFWLPRRDIYSKKWAVLDLNQ